MPVSTLTWELVGWNKYFHILILSSDKVVAFWPVIKEIKATSSALNNLNYSVKGCIVCLILQGESLSLSL